MRTLVIALSLVAFLLGGCAFPTFRGYVGPVRPNEQLVVLENRWSWGFPDMSTCPFCVRRIVLRGGKVVYDETRDGAVTRFRLRPGTYEITYSKSVYKIGEISRRDLVTLEAGHRYRVVSDVHVNARRASLWIQDRETGELVAGRTLRPGRWQGPETDR